MTKERNNLQIDIRKDEAELLSLELKTKEIEEQISPLSTEDANKAKKAKELEKQKASIAKINTSLNKKRAR